MCKVGVFTHKGEPNKHKRVMCKKIIEKMRNRERGIKREGEGKRNTEQEK